jgi:hypothetical protein
MMARRLFQSPPGVRASLAQARPNGRGWLVTGALTLVRDGYGSGWPAGLAAAGGGSGSRADGVRG